MVSKGIEHSDGTYGYSTNDRIFGSANMSGSYNCSGIQGVYGFAISCKTKTSGQNGGASVKWNVEYN